MHLQKEISDMGRTIAIGDIHGCSTALGLLIDIVQPESCDTLICLGDIIDYGPDSKKAIEQLLELNEKTNLVLIMGNHEEMLLEVVKGNEDIDHWKKFGGDKALESYQCDHPREIPYEHPNFIGKSVPFLKPNPIFLSTQVTKRTFRFKKQLAARLDGIF
jgi:serine/threonine protein phosphatase 1